MRLLDELARQDSFIHRLHPLIKLLTTLIFLMALVSFPRDQVSGLLPFVFYPLLLLVLADLPAAPIVRRVLLVEPLIIGVGILNPLLDTQPVQLGHLVIARGWLTFAAIVIKSSLTVSASILLVATMGIDQLAAALRLLKVPKIFVLQLLLTYRYLSVLIEETARMMRAHTLRAPSQRGLQRGAWGSFMGQLVLRTLARAQRVYQAMILRGFSGEYHTGHPRQFSLAGLAFLVAWSLFFWAARVNNLAILLGSLIMGVMTG